MRLWLPILIITLPRCLCASDEADYSRDIKPLIAEKCGACHGALKQENRLRLDTGMLIVQGSDTGPVIVPGRAGESLLVDRVTAEDPAERMPPEGQEEPLTAEQVALLKTWIDAGALVPKDESIPADPRDHWAYQVPVRPQVPRVEDSESSHPIDAFIARHHRRLGLTPSGPATTGRSTNCVVGCTRRLERPNKG